MDDRFNTIAGWTLFSGIVALGFSSVSGMHFGANKPHRPEKMGYEIAGVEEEGDGGTAVPLETLLAAADPAKGEKIFAKCTNCHNATQGGANSIGPNLFGIVGAPVGKRSAGFAYSAALSGHGGNWDFASLDTWLKRPDSFADGTSMTFQGMASAEERANLIVWLNQQGSNVPLPAAPAAAPADAAAAPAAGVAAPAEPAKH